MEAHCVAVEDQLVTEAQIGDTYESCSPMMAFMRKANEENVMVTKEMLSINEIKKSCNQNLSWFRNNL